MKGEGNRRKEVNDGFTFPALIQKIRVIPNDFFTPQAESFWFTASLSHFEKPGHFQSLSQNTVRRKSESETEWILLEVWNNWVMYCTANRWLRRSSHCLQSCASHLSHCQSFSHFFTHTTESNSWVIAKCCSRFDSVRVIESFLRRCGGVTGRLTEIASAAPITDYNVLQESSLKQPVKLVKILYFFNIEVI